MKMMTKAIEKQLPALYSQESKGLEALVQLHYFNPTGHGDWYITEWDGEDTMFGLCCLQERELGYVSLAELIEYRGRFGLGIERDLCWKPVPLKVVMKEDR